MSIPPDADPASKKSSQPYQFFEDISPEEFEILKEDIRLRGVQTAIEITPEGEILDGHQRHRACMELGLIDFPRRIILGLDEDGKIHHAIKANCIRRQLNRQQRRELIIAELRRNPKHSNRLLAELVGVDKNTVQSIRNELEAGGEIHHLHTRDGKDGKAYRPSSFFAPDEEAEKRVKALIKKIDGVIPEGRHMTLPDGKALLSQQRRSRRQQVQKEVARAHGSFEVHNLGLTGAYARVSKESADLLFTHPAWKMDNESTYGELASLAEHVLKPGAFLAIYVGSSDLALAIQKLGDHLQFVTTFGSRAWVPKQRSKSLIVIDGWKQLLIFRKESAAGLDASALDFARASSRIKVEEPDPDIAEAMECIHLLGKDKGLVIDPLMDIGTIGLAAIRCGMSFMGFEERESACKHARIKLTNAQKRLPL